jgi:plastocyanin
VPAIEVLIERDTDWGFGWILDPMGLYVEPGQVVRWRSLKGGATVTAYHPAHDNHELRIPEGAAPFDSGTLGSFWKTTFEWRFEQEGTYDYYSRPHEVLGVVGRIVVGRPGGPGEQALGYGAEEGRAPIYKRARQLLEHVTSEKIMKAKKIPFPEELFGRRY